MKLSLLLIFLLLSMGIKAQYSPLVKTDSTSWIIKHELIDYAKIESLYLTGTITLNGKIYYPTYYNDDNGGPVALVGYFREDSSIGKAWFLGIKDTSEYLIMDLDLVIGDSILVKTYARKNQYAHVTGIIKENNRKVIMTDYHIGGGFISENLKFIEGVGPNASLLYQLEQATASKINMQGGFLVCKAYNDKDLVYAWDPINFECGYMWDNIESNIDKKITIYHNPSSQILKISGEQNLEVAIFDLMGKLVLTSNKKEININGLSNGIYLVRLSTEGKIVATEKIIKNNVSQ